MTTAIRIENVSKLYRLGTVGTGTIAHDLNRWWHQIRGKEDPYAKIGQVNDRTKRAASDEKREASEDPATSSPLASRHSQLSSPSPLASSNSQLPSPSPLASRNSSLQASGPDYVWALKDINLEVAQGEILGIIGRNGAGKSTLLKLLSRVTAPTTGSIKTKGRIASLLEVGTGFHPDLTGRENIYMNGAILGMRRHEITRQLDEIVEFSGCAKYLDTPVKRYSSGMMVRLGFGVAAHLQCEILIVDEVLAVGDFEFQQKCLGKMKAVANAGKTVIFVSHNIPTISALCTTVHLMECGHLCEPRPPREQICRYLESATRTASTLSLEHRTDRAGSQLLRINNVTFHRINSNEETVPQSGEDLLVRFHYESKTQLRNASINLAFNVKLKDDTVLTNLNTHDTSFKRTTIEAYGFFECHWPKLNLRPDEYLCNVFCSIDGEISDWIQDAFVLKVDEGDYYETGKVPPPTQGYVFVTHTWQHTALPIGDISK